MSIRLQPIKQVLWKRIKNKINSDDIPHSEHIEFIHEEYLISTRLEITKNTLVGLLDIDIFIEHLPVVISDKKGFVDIVFSLPYIEKCEVDKISIENWSNILDDNLKNLQTQLINDWNS